jgi:hypothetical protein
MHKLPLAAVAAALLISASPVFAESRTLDTGEFTAIQVATGIEAEIVVGGPLSVVAEAPGASDFNDFRYQVTGGKLEVWYDWTIFQLFGPRDREMMLTITVPTLTEIVGTTASRVDVRGPTGNELRVEATTGAAVEIAGAQAATYALSSTTGSTLTIEGSCDRASVEVTTGSSLRAENLACSEVTAEATTGGHLTITATESVSGEATTGASITIHGSPQVNHLATSTGASVNFPS